MQKSNSNNAMIAGCLLAGLAVLIGAFGAHALKDLLIHNEKVDVFETGVKYHFYHALALLAVGLFSRNSENRWLTMGFYSFVIGTIFFSGSLYLLSIMNLNPLGIITPIGGLILLAGWIFFALGIKKATPIN